MSTEVSLMPFQKVGVEWLTNRKYGLLADEQGLGKTVQAAWIAEPGTIIVCPSSVAINWVQWVRRIHPNYRVQRISKRGEIVDSNAIDVIVVPWSLLADFDPPVPSTLILDEGHYAKSHTAQRSIAAATIAKHADRVYVLTGTPIPNRPRELWTLLRMLRATNLSRVEFGEEYCAGEWVERRVFDRRTQEYRTVRVFEDMGASNLLELREKVLGPVMLRRLKKDVLADLPPKMHCIVEIDGGKISQGELDLSVSLVKSIDELGNLRPKGEQFTKLSKVRKQIGDEKIAPTIEWVRDFFEANENKSLVVFAWHANVIDAITKEFEEYGVSVIDGRTPTEDRKQIEDEFQAGKTRLFVGNIVAAGTGLTLTRASHLLFAELDWVPGNLAQAADRIHRITQTQPATIYYLVRSGGLEHRILEAQWDKVINIETVLGDDES